jgi:uncharacterized protein YbjT (DUF2867 family)
MADMTVLVVGATRGTGAIIATRLKQRGTRVRVLARRPERAAATLGEGFDIVAGDVTKPDTLPAAVAGVSHIVYTAGVQSYRLAREAIIRLTEYGGPVNTLFAARDAGFSGRFLFMTSMGIMRSSLSARFLNAFKGKTLEWRRRAEEEIRAIGIDYAIIRAGFLLDATPGRHAIAVTQGNLPLSPRYRIGRADVAEVFVAALTHPRASKATFEVAWTHGPPPRDWNALLDRLTPD